MSKAERMTQWRHSRQLFDPESEAGLATPSSARSAGVVGGAEGIPDAASHGTPYWTPPPVCADATATRASPGPDGAPTTSATPVSNSDIASSLHLALASATNEIDRLTRALETARALRDVAKTRVEEETALRLAAKAREDAAESARAEAEAAMLAAHASAKAHEEECRFLAERAFEAEAHAHARLDEARRELGARWDEETAARDSELAACRAREEDANEAFGDLVRAVDAERARWTSERAARDAELEAARATWAAERAALVEALEVSFDDDDGAREPINKARDDARVVRVIQSVTAAVTAERASLTADVHLEHAGARADAAAADALARADAREAARREDALRAALAESRAALEGAEASRAAFESAAARAARDAARAEAEAREAREERDAVAAEARHPDELPIRE